MNAVRLSARLSLTFIIVLLAVPLLMADVFFQPPVNYPTGSGPIAVVAADFNHDGWADLLVANFGSVNVARGSVSILINNGDGTFDRGLNYDKNVRVSSVAAGDFNDDGNLDAAAMNLTGGTVDILLGNGDGIFQTPVSYAAGSNAQVVVAGDLNGDNKPDLVTESECGPPPCASSGVNVMLNNGDGTFAAPVFYSTSQKGAHAPILGDLNLDSKLDVAVGTDAGVAVFVGNGDGTLRKPLFQTAPFAVTSLAIGQFDAGLDPDLAFTNPGEIGGAVGTVGILLGQGRGKFTPKPVGQIQHPMSVAAGDLDGDSKMDLAVKGGSDTNLGVLLGNGDGTFQHVVRFDVFNRLGTVALADLNNDTLLDAIVADHRGAVLVLINAGP
jgi:hypothetical protein